VKPVTFWQRLGRAVRDRSFIIGSILVAIFVLVAVLGPEVAPHNPFHRDRVRTVGGELGRAPFPPSALYPLGTDDQGRDLLSLLLYGARQTLVIAFVAMTVRLVLALLLGTLSGWWAGSLFDRAVTSITEFLSAVPGLIMTILLVLAIGIRRGQVTFIVALSAVGWGEATQIVRGLVLTIRNRLFILASRAVGLDSPQILSRHVLPNLLSTLLALAALEMAAVLLLLGELGFVHVFIGGGGIYVDDSVQLGQQVHFFEVPDWGAMLGTSWPYFRALPWLPLAPALAFFVSILGFNLFGYGLQRFVEAGRFHPSGWSVLRFFAVVAVTLWGAQALLASTSLEAQFADMARQFDAQRAWNDVVYLTQPELEGRPSGPGGGHNAAAYIASQFAQAGLTPLTNGTYYQPYETWVGRVTQTPHLAVVDEAGEPFLDLSSGVGFDARRSFIAEGTWVGELLVASNTRETTSVGSSEGVLVMLLRAEDAMPGGWYSYRLPFAGALRLVPDDRLDPRHHPPSPWPLLNSPIYPYLLIGESAARELLAEADLDLDELLAGTEDGHEMQVRTGLQVQIGAGLSYDEASAVNVVGYLPAADMTTQGDRILVAARYTSPLVPHDAFYPGADEDASSVAVMLEIARLWHDLGFEPKRTVVFAALDVGGGSYFVNQPIFPAAFDDSWTAVDIHGIGAGDSRLARFESSPGLERTFDQSARRMGVRTQALDDWRFFFTAWYGSTHEAYSGLAVTRPGDELSGTPGDGMEHLDPQLIGEAGWALAHYLMVLSNR
jgi:ABC-type dipeptide/oligopeptide/nickel transport system permease subunit